MHTLVPTELIELTTLFSEPGRSMKSTSLPNLRIARSDRPTVPIYRVYAPSLCFIVQGEKESIIGARKYAYGPGQLLVNSVTIPVTGQITKANSKKPYLCLVLEIESAVVYELLDTVNFKPLSHDRSIFVDRSTPDLTDALLRLVRTLQDEQEQKILAPLITREIIFRLLNSKFGQSVREIGMTGSQLQRISRAIDFLRTDIAADVRMGELAKIANMSASTFHHHFKDATGMSPLQYQKTLRLQEARRLLLTEIADAATAGFRVGYESPSQFSREYRRHFGASPMQDMKRLREETRP